MIGSYHDWHIPVYISTIEHASPPINIPGVVEYVSALDTNLLSALAGNLTPAQAMKNTAKTWEDITNKKGRDKQIEALKKARDAWPKTVDTAKLK